MSVILQNPHAVALKTTLEAITFLDNPLRVGDGIAPKAPNNGPILSPCVALYMLPGGNLASSVGCLDGDGWLRFQTTSIGTTAAQARIIDDLCRARLAANPPTVTNRYTRVRPDFASSRVEHDTSVSPPLFYVATTYRLLSNTA